MPGRSWTLSYLSSVEQDTTSRFLSCRTQAGRHVRARPSQPKLAELQLQEKVARRRRTTSLPTRAPPHLPVILLTLSVPLLTKMVTASKEDLGTGRGDHISVELPALIRALLPPRGRDKDDQMTKPHIPPFFFLSPV